MRILEYILFGFVFFLVILTSYYWRKQKTLKKKRYLGSKYDALEVSQLDSKYQEYYEPKIVEIVSTEEYL